jgi:hypothetical protein
MNLITRIRQAAARQRKNLVLLLQTYQTVAGRAPAWHQQIVEDYTQRVLDSTEIRNAMSYAKINANDLLTRAIEQSGKLLRLENSPMNELTVYQRGSYSALKENIFHALREHSRAASETAGPSSGAEHLPPPVSRGDGGSITYKHIGAVFVNLADPIASSLIALMLELSFLVIAINIIVGVILGSNSVLLTDALFIITTILIVYLAARNCGKYTLAGKKC